MYKVNLSLKEIPYPHSKERAKELLVEIADEFGITKKVENILSDGASNLHGIELGFPGSAHFICAFHTLQLTVHKILEKKYETINKIREVSKFFRHSKQEQRVKESQKQNKNILVPILDSQTRC